MTIPFDTTRLDEECERIATEITFDSSHFFAPRPETVRAVILGDAGMLHGLDIAHVATILARCRRPKMVPA